jgi:ABC-type transport system involved in multi-copper enzyme maturation permease subunit
LFVYPYLAAWYVGYVLIFNMLVGPVFSAGSITSERERQTLDLLLVTAITPWQILTGKLIAGLRISTVLTLFLVWPLFLAVVMVSYYWSNLLSVFTFLSIILMTCVTTALIALFCSALFHKTSTSLMTTYAAIIVLFCAPLAATVFAKSFLSGNEQSTATRGAVQSIEYVGVSSPFAAAFSVPLSTDPLVFGGASDRVDSDRFFPSNWRLVGLYFAFTAAMLGVLGAAMVWLLRTRWRVAQ